MRQSINEKKLPSPSPFLCTVVCILNLLQSSVNVLFAPKCLTDCIFVLGQRHRGGLLEIKRKSEKYPKSNFMKNFLILQMLTVKYDCCQIPSYYLICLKGTCVLENGNY